MPGAAEHAYEAAVAKLRLATLGTESLVAIVRDAAAKLTNWKTAHFSNIDPDTHGGYGPRAFRLDQAINASTWPSAVDIHNALTAWNAAADAVIAAWTALSPQEQRGREHPA